MLRFVSRDAWGLEEVVDLLVHALANHDQTRVRMEVTLLFVVGWRFKNLGLGVRGHLRGSQLC